MLHSVAINHDFKGLTFSCHQVKSINKFLNAPPTADETLTVNAIKIKIKQLFIRRASAVNCKQLTLIRVVSPYQGPSPTLKQSKV